VIDRHGQVEGHVVDNQDEARSSTRRQSLAHGFCPPLNIGGGSALAAPS
jgi:hypothetical protein